jgi:hypothetical protein
MKKNLINIKKIIQKKLSIFYKNKISNFICSYRIKHYVNIKNYFTLAIFLNHNIFEKNISNKKIKNIGENFLAEFLFLKSKNILNNQIYYRLKFLKFKIMKIKKIFIENFINKNQKNISKNIKIIFNNIWDNLSIQSFKLVTIFKRFYKYIKKYQFIFQILNRFNSIKKMMFSRIFLAIFLQFFNLNCRK